MLSDFLALFFPRFCAACEGALAKGEKVICLQCDYKMAKAGGLTDNNNFVAKKFFGRVHLQYAWAYYLFNKRGRIQRLVHRMKYDQMPEIGEFVGHKLGAALLRQGLQHKFDVVIPIPLHKSKLKKRGYNQSEYFGSGISKALEVPLDAGAVVRTVNTASQTKKSRLARWKNVDSIFDVKDMAHVRDKHILLVDDVITTGSTIEACALSLQHAGAASVSVAAMAAAK